MSNTADRTAVPLADRRQPVADISQIEVVAPNFKRRLSGITSTLLRILPEQAKSLSIATAGVPFGAAMFAPASSRVAAKAALGFGDGPLVGCFGRIRAQKGTDVFVEAMIAVLPAFPNARAVVLGRATEAHRAFLDGLKRRVVEAGLAGRIVFPGEVRADATVGWYQALDVFVAPQRSERFGVTPLEAGACAVPVVATTVGAFPELVVDGVPGTLVPPGDTTAMVAAVR